jgi:hypothetical protein
MTPALRTPATKMGCPILTAFFAVRVGNHHRSFLAAYLPQKLGAPGASLLGTWETTKNMGAPGPSLLGTWETTKNMGAPGPSHLGTWETTNVNRPALKKNETSP